MIKQLYLTSRKKYKKGNLFKIFWGDELLTFLKKANLLFKNLILLLNPLSFGMTVGHPTTTYISPSPLSKNLHSAQCNERPFH